MRPLRLELEGFACYREPVEIDFAGLDLLAISGPTGSGKSSLVDAIAYALYGRVPRVGSEIKDCMSQGLERMSVTLEFGVGDERYRVCRSTSRRGRGSVQLDRQQDGSWEAVEVGAQPVSDSVERLVGLSYDGFTRSVLLPQGQFQQFLVGEPQQRRRVLQELLRLDAYARVATRAGQLAAEAQNRAEDIGRRLREDYSDATPEALAEKRRLREEMAAGLDTLEEELRFAVVSQQLAERLESACAEITAAGQALQEASALRDKASQLADQGEEEVARLSERLGGIKKQIESNAFDASALAALKVALATAYAVEDLSARLDDRQAREEGLRAEVAGAEEALGRAREEESSAEREMQRAREGLEELRRQNAAGFLRRDLRHGDPCPVCLQTVADVPPAADVPLEEAEARVKRAERGERQAREAVTNAERMLSGLAQAMTDAGVQLKAVGQERELKQAELVGQLRSLHVDQQDSLARLVDCHEEARIELEELERERLELETELREKERLVTQAKQELSGLLARVQAAEGWVERAETGARKLADDLVSNLSKSGRETVLPWTGLPGPAVEVVLAAGQWAVPAMTASARECQRARDDATARSALLGNDIDRLVRDIGRATELRAEEGRCRQELNVARDLAELLRADRFQAFVQEEALRILAEDGSRHLEDLSSGRYAFDVSGQEFLVADRWNGDEKRPVKTLSGGETFLASLALALSLAERLPGLAGGDRQVRLESLFLDEGFGSLDAESLEVVTQAVEALRSDRRMVCLVTHVRELAERMPQRIEVVKGEGGSRVVVKR